MDFLFPLLKNSESGVDDRGHRFRSGSPLANYPYATLRLDAHRALVIFVLHILKGMFTQKEHVDFRGKI